MGTEECEGVGQSKPVHFWPEVEIKSHEFETTGISEGRAQSVLMTGGVGRNIKSDSTTYILTTGSLSSNREWEVCSEDTKTQHLRVLGDTGSAEGNSGVFS